MNGMQIDLLEYLELNKEIDVRTARVKEFIFAPCNIREIRGFIERWHYSGNTNGIKTEYCFKLMYHDEIIGVAVFAKLGMANVWKKYAETENDLIELRRLCCIDLTPKNTESYFIGHCIRWIKKNTNAKSIISYADKDFGHIGTIYKATNFTYLGTTSTGRVIIYNGKRYHDKTIRTYYKGKLKPYAEKIKNALAQGDAEYIMAQGKHIYFMKL